MTIIRLMRKRSKNHVDTFLIHARALGINLNGASVRALREKVIPGSNDIIHFVTAVKDLHL